MKKAKARKIREIAERMGSIQTHIMTEEPIKGWELLLSGYGKRPGAKKIIPDATYYLPVPTRVEHSSKKELKRQYYKNGDSGIFNVVKHEHDKRIRIKKDRKTPDL